CRPGPCPPPACAAASCSSADAAGELSAKAAGYSPAAAMETAASPPALPPLLLTKEWVYFVSPDPITKIQAITIHILLSLIRSHPCPVLYFVRYRYLSTKKPDSEYEDKRSNTS